MLQLVVNSLKAALIMAGTKDVRYYLKGVCVSVTAEKKKFTLELRMGRLRLRTSCPDSVKLTGLFQ